MAESKAIKAPPINTRDRDNPARPQAHRAAQQQVTVRKAAPIGELIRGVPDSSSTAALAPICGRAISGTPEKDAGTSPRSWNLIPPMMSSPRPTHAPGIDVRKESKTNSGRPIAIVRNGTPIPELFARSRSRYRRGRL